MSSIADESAAERHVRWSELRAHLRAEGAGNIPPGLLRNPVPNKPTRPEVPLIAYYDNVKQVSLGRLTPKDLIKIVLYLTVAILALPHVADVADFGNQQWTWPDFVLDLILFGIVLLLVWELALRPLINAITTTRGPLGLSSEGLNLTLPDRDLHTRWRDVYTATCVRRPVLGQTRFFCRTTCAWNSTTACPPGCMWAGTTAHRWPGRCVH